MNVIAFIGKIFLIFITIFKGIQRKRKRNTLSGNIVYFFIHFASKKHFHKIFDIKIILKKKRQLKKHC